MNKDHGIGLLVLLGIISIALFGGSKGSGNNGLLSSGNATPEQKQTNIQQQINTTQYQIDTLQKQIQEENDKKTRSQYYGLVSIAYINRSTTPDQEYVALRVDYSATTSIPITGWTLKSTSSGNLVKIPKGNYLYFSGQVNSEENIYLNKGDTMYVVTGVSPIGLSFRSNKCSGYLGQFQTFVPYIGGSCPSPRNENLSSIPNGPNNDACFDYIDSFPNCRIQTDPLPANLSYECNTFIYKKINYASCIDTHKNDKDFYVPEWRVYLRHADHIWKDRRENIVLYDNLGKIVASLSY